MTEDEDEEEEYKNQLECKYLMLARTRERKVLLPKCERVTKDEGATTTTLCSYSSISYATFYFSSEAVVSLLQLWRNSLSVSRI